MFNYPIDEDTELKILEERDAERLFLLIDSSRDTLRNCKAIVNFCFDELKLKRIEIRVATQNYKSLAIPYRLGFKKEGCLEDAEFLHGEFVDHYIFSLIK